MGECRLRAAWAVALLLVWAGTAWAAPPAPGELRLVPGQCGSPPCTAISAAVLSPDGRDLYAMTPGAVLGYHRASGAVLPTRISGALGCIGASPGCQQLGNGFLPGRARLSPDGRFLYVGQQQDGGLFVFARDTTTGKLTPVRGTGGCFGGGGFMQCGLASTLFSFTDLTVGDTLLVAGDGSGWTIFDRDPITGRLALTAGGCFQSHANFGDCLVFPDGPVDTMPDRLVPVGRFLYGVTGQGLRLFNQTITGWTQATGPGSCIGPPGCPAQRAFGDELSPSPDGAWLYRGGFGDLEAIRIDPLTGRMTPDRCWSAFAPCLPGILPSTPGQHTSRSSSIAFSADGQLAAVTGDGLGTFQRSPASSDLSPTQTSAPCVEANLSGCADVQETSIALSADGRTALWTMQRASRSLLLAGEQPPGCDTHARHTATSAAVALTFGCGDINGDAFTVSVVGGPAHGALSAITPAGATYLPAAGFAGTDAVRLHLAGDAPTDVVIPIVVGGAPYMSPIHVQTPFLSRLRATTKRVPRIAVFYGDPLTVTMHAAHGVTPFARARVHAAGWAAADVTTDERGGAEFAVPTRLPLRITLAVSGFPVTTRRQVDVAIKPHLDADGFAVRQKGKIRIGASVTGEPVVRRGRVHLQRKVHGAWVTVQTLKIDRNLHVAALIRKAQIRGPWRFAYVPLKAPYLRVVAPFTVPKPS